MKRWNKQKKRRETCWTKVTGIKYNNYRSAVRWCLAREGKRFFNADYTSTFFFEDAEDATAFYLTWISK
jgi:hypothetical protein